jgi:CRISPR-associated protein Cmr3
MSTHGWLAVEPLDTVMVRDGRRFDAGVSARATATAPPPSTFGGALHTAFDAPVGEIHGFVVSTDAGLVFPAPTDVVRHDGVNRRLRAEQRPNGEWWDLDDDHRMSHALAGDGEPCHEWVTADGLHAWLRAERPYLPGAELGVAPGMVDPPWQAEPRLGLARHWDGELIGTSRSGLLYTMSHLRPRYGTRFLVPFTDDGEPTLRRDIVPLGGRGRLAHITLNAGQVPGLPQAPDCFPGGRLTVYLATPALFGVDPDAPNAGQARTDVYWAPGEATLCAVALPGLVPIATASNRPGGRHADTRRLMWAAPAGTVFYLRFDDDASALCWSKDHHGRLLPGASNSPLRTAGFGLCLTGSW